MYLCVCVFPYTSVHLDWLAWYHESLFRSSTFHHVKHHHTAAYSIPPFILRVHAESNAPSFVDSIAVRM